MGDPRLLLPSREGKGKAEASAGLKCVHTVGVNTCTSNKATRHVQCKGKRGKSRVGHRFLATSTATAPEARGKGGQDRRRVLTLLRLHN